jgi:hypothetical protein
MSNRQRSKLSRIVIASIFSLLLAFTVWYEVEALQMRRQIAGEAVREVQAARLLDRHIGTPIHVGYFVSGRVIVGTDAGTADLEISVSGPKGSGKLIDWSQNSFVGWHVCSVTYRAANGPDVVLFPDETAKCERE